MADVAALVEESRKIKQDLLQSFSDYADTQEQLIEILVMTNRVQQQEIERLREALGETNDALACYVWPSEYVDAPDGPAVIKRSAAILAAPSEASE